MSLATSASTSSLFRRPSSKPGQSSSFLDSTDSPKPHRRRFSSMFGHQSPPSLDQPPQHQSRPRARSYKNERVTMESGDSPLPYRTSFIDLGDESPKRRDLENKVFGSLRGRLNKKQSAPSLNYFTYSPTLPPLDSSSTAPSPSSPGTSPNQQPLPKPSPIKRSLSGYRLRRSQSTSLDAGSRPSLNLRDYRKKTATPEEIIDGVGYLRRSRRDSVNPEIEEEEENMTPSQGNFQALPFRKKGCMLLHRYPREIAPYMSSYNKVDLQK